MEGGKEPWYSTEIETDVEIRDRSREKPAEAARQSTKQGYAALLGTKGQPSKFRKGFSFLPTG